MNKFKIGDKVRLRDDLEVGEKYGKAYFLNLMKKSQGKEVTIEGITSQGYYTLKESDLFYSEEMLEKVVDDTDDLLEFALSEFNMTKEELREKYEKNKTEKQVVESMKKCFDDFVNYCSSRGCCACDVYKFKERNNLRGLGDRSCIMIYEYLFKKEE